MSDYNIRRSEKELRQAIRDYLTEKADELADEFIENVKTAVQLEREECVKLVEEQPYYPNTHTGIRQQWVKDEIVKKIRARGNKS